MESSAHRALDPAPSSTGSQEPAPAHAGTDPFPFGADPWWGKAITVAIVILPLVALGYAIHQWWGHGVGAAELWMLLGFWAFTGLGISVGFHRMLTHRAFTARPATKFLLLAAGTMALEGPPAGWAATHLRHHAKADTPDDPHSPLAGFWHSHFGWLLKDRMVHDGLAFEKLMADPMVAFFSRTWHVWTVLSLGLPALVGFLVGGTWMAAWNGFLWGGVLRIGLLHHTTWSVNSVAHTFGSRPFRTPDVARNNGAVALLGWGEGWHNNHHAFPRAAYIGMRWYQVDIGAYVIRGLQAIGQATHVWNPTKAERRARLRKARPAR